ncbi:hypothetical protein M0811_14822 [Anaeramoeba ignava]|uniref:ATPase dynein-related AAA domain-containing protein n=1 Tax=Anaeramoeba ignava TaxID=1746090 RepID=A0A9Q0LWC8_ANAIG|nr:hypothetical protein M0811_14822 [Anaeramoeba ignava]
MMIGIILSIFISYGCRFSVNLRSDYYSYILQDIKITPFFQNLKPAFPTTTNEFLEAINQLRTQFFRNIDDKSYLKSQAIAANEALTENLLVEFICIQTKIPLFIIGKPGTSKSLSIDILKNWLSNSSNNEYVRKGKLKRIRVFPLQCSPQTTPRAIEKIFEQARRYQQQQKDYLENLKIKKIKKIKNFKNFNIKEKKMFQLFC